MKVWSAGKQLIPADHDSSQPRRIPYEPVLYHIHYTKYASDQSVYSDPFLYWTPGPAEGGTCVEKMAVGGSGGPAAAASSGICEAAGSGKRGGSRGGDRVFCRRKRGRSRSGPCGSGVR